MKIILVGYPSAFNLQIKEAFEHMGLEVLLVNERANRLVPGFLQGSRFLWQAVKKFTFFKEWNNRRFGHMLVELCRQTKPDVFFTTKGTTIKPETVETIKSLGITTANWFPENIYNEPYLSWFLKTAKHYDFFFTFDSSVIERFPEYGNLHYLPFAVDLKPFEKVKISEEDRQRYSCDICFVGAKYPEREELLTSVKDLNIKIYGWKDWESSPLASYYHGPLNLAESVKAYRCAKICLNTNINPPINGVNAKTFEIAAAGGFQLSDYRKDIDGLFEVGKEIEIFHDPLQFREKVEFYLKNTDLREQIAAAAQSRVMKDHTMGKRVREILNIVR